MTILRVGVVLDKWKLPTFRRILDDNGYIYTEWQGATYDTCILKIDVDSEDLLALEEHVRKAQKESKP